MKKILLVIIIILMICGLFVIYINLNTIKDNKKIEQQSEEYFLDEFEDKKGIENAKVIGNLEIKKINLNGPIKEGSNSKVLKDYIGHIEETPIYNGNVCLAAHNRGNKHSYFSRINELMKGDEITYNTDIFSKNYRVNIIKEIDETDWKMLEDSSDNMLTLITCIKNKKDKRLCVQALEV